MKIISENTIDKKDTYALANFGRSSLKFMLILLFFTFTAFLIFSIINNNKENRAYAVVGTIWCAGAYAYSFLIQPQLAFRAFQKKYSRNAVIKFIFDQKNLAVTINGENETFNQRKGYCNIFKIIESDDYFFVYFKRDESYIMKKSGLIQGNLKDVSEILSSEMGTKYIRKVKKHD